MSKFTEEKLEQAIIALLEDQGFPHSTGDSVERNPQEVLIKADLRTFLSQSYARDNITDGEIDAVIRRLEALPAADLYGSNKHIHKLVSDGFLLKREDHTQKDLYIQLIDYAGLPEQRTPLPDEVERILAEKRNVYDSGLNCYRVVNQLEIHGSEKRIPDAILYINGLPLVVFEFKSAIREEATIHDAYVQLTTLCPRYPRTDEVQRPVRDQRRRQLTHGFAVCPLRVLLHLAQGDGQ